MTSLKTGKLADISATIEEAAKAQVYGDRPETNDGTTEAIRSSDKTATVVPKDLADFTGRTQRNVEVVSACAIAFANTSQEIAQRWLELSRKLVERNMEAMTKVGGATSVEDAAKVQREIMLAGLEDFVQETRAIAETSLKAGEAVRKVLAGS